MLRKPTDIQHKFQNINLLFKTKNREQFIRAAQNPVPCMYVVGEMISRKQGWTEGALESVNAIISKFD